MKYSNISTLLHKYSMLISLAALEDELNKLTTSDENKEFIKKIELPQFKGKLFSELRKNPGMSLDELKTVLKDLQQEQQKKEKLKESSIPEEWKPVIDNLREGRLQVFLRSLARQNKLPVLNNDTRNKIATIEHYLQEHPTTSIQNSFDDFYKIAKDWEDSFKNTISGYEKRDIVYGPGWKNSDFNGHTINEITTESDLKREGGLLNHCVGGGTYFNKIKNNESRIFSLRTSSDLPLITIETSPDLYTFKQTFGKKNSQPNATEMSMINEWKQVLHPTEKILAFAISDNKQDRINAASFMDYNNPDYRTVIDDFILNEKDSGKGFIGSEAENKSKDVLQALAANETLASDCYEKIYDKCRNNNSTVFNLVRNPKISDNLFIKIYKNSKNEIILKTIASSFALAKSSQSDEIIKFIVETSIASNDNNLLLILLNNPSIQSAKIKNILNNLNESVIREIFYDNDKLKNFDPKFIDDIIESKNPALEKYYTKILLHNNNLNQELLEKFYKVYGKLPVEVDKYNLLEQLPLGKIIDYNPDMDMGLAENFTLSTEQFNTLLAKDNDDINYNLARNPNLTTEQISTLLAKDNDNINYNLSENPNLTTEQISTLLAKDNNNINYNLSGNPNLTTEQISTLLAKNNNNINYNLSVLHNLTTEQFNTLLAKNNNIINHNLSGNPNLTTEQISTLLAKNNNNNINYNLSGNPNLTTEQISTLLAKNNNNINYNLSRNPSLTTEQFNTLLAKNNDDINSNLSRNPNLTTEQISTLLAKDNDDINRFLSGNPNLTTEQFNTLLAKDNDDINSNLSRNPSLTTEQFNTLLAKDNDNINYNLSENPNLTTEQINALLAKNNNKINYNLANNRTVSPNLTTEQISTLLAKDNDYINYNLAKNPNLTKRQVLKFLEKTIYPENIFQIWNKSKQADRYYSLLKLASRFAYLTKLLLN